MYIENSKGILPINLQDKWITFQTLVNVLKPSRIIFPFTYPLFFYFVFDGKNPVALYNYDSFHSSIWMISKVKFTFNNDELEFSFSRLHREKKRIKAKELDFESARKFIEYLELF